MNMPDIPEIHEAPESGNQTWLNQPAYIFADG